MGLATRIERVPADPYLGRRLDALKALRRFGWDVAALVAPDARSVVLLAAWPGSLQRRNED